MMNRYNQKKESLVGGDGGDGGDGLNEKESKSYSVFVVDACKGFFRSLELGITRPIADKLQDTLRLLTVWFNNGEMEDLNVEMEKGLESVSVDTWLFVIPQLIAR
tara:strand:+ start:1182 stop:1496 length:315 start_codon:yes stop_codon:yes gene_type:complete